MALSGVVVPDHGKRAQLRCGDVLDSVSSARDVGDTWCLLQSQRGGRCDPPSPFPNCLFLAVAGRDRVGRRPIPKAHPEGARSALAAAKTAGTLHRVGGRGSQLINGR